MKTHSLPLVVVALTLTGCLEAPVTESLQLRVEHSGASMVAVDVALRDPSDYANAPRVRHRLEFEAREMQEGSDAWSRRIRRADPERQDDLISREKGQVRRVARAAEFNEPRSLQAFFDDTDVDVAFAAGDDWAELTLTPTRPSRATSSQRARVASELSSFGAHVSVYAAAIGTLYDYLGTYPDRARACMAAIFDVPLDDEELTDAESAIIADVTDAINALGSILEPASDEPYTLDEISRMVYDPFPAPMLIAVDGEITEIEGFEDDAKTPLRIPARSIWSAFAGLEGRWFSPDPALALWRHDLANTGRPFDLDAFLALPRRAGKVPTSKDVRGEIEERLKPQDQYRVRWTPSSPAPPL